MKFDIISMYCGGFILKGLYNFQYTMPINTLRGKLITSIGDYKEKYKNFWDKRFDRVNLPTSEDFSNFMVHSLSNLGDVPRTSPDIPDYFPYVPDDFRDFCRIFEVYMLKSTSHYRGTIIAITNESQNVAASHLKEAGFGSFGPTSKNGPGSGLSLCTTWVGDYHNVVRPKIRSAIGNVREPKKSAFGLR